MRQTGSWQSLHIAWPVRYQNQTLYWTLTDGSTFKLVFQMQERSYQGEDVMRFLRLLLRKIAGPLLVMWDGSPIHRGQAVKAFLAKGAAKRMHLERLPGYWPDLNPEESIWNLLRRRELKNVCCHDLAELTNELQLAKGRLRHRRETILACFAHAACPLPFPTLNSGGTDVLQE
jgi:transposase